MSHWKRHYRSSRKQYGRYRFNSDIGFFFFNFPYLYKYSYLYKLYDNKNLKINPIEASNCVATRDNVNKNIG